MAKKRNNYFSDNIKNYGENFLQSFDAKKLRSDARRIISDIAFGNIDFDEYGIYFSDPVLINALIDVAHTKLVIHGTSYNALEFSSHTATNSDMEMVKRYHRRLTEAYSLFYDYFVKIKSSGYSGESIANLKALSNRAKDYSADLIDPVFSNNSGISDASVYTTTPFQQVFAQSENTVYVTNDPIETKEPEIHELKFNNLIKE